MIISNQRCCLIILIFREIKVGRTVYSVSVKGPVASTSVQDIYDAMRREGGVIPIDAVNALNIVLSQGFNNGSYVTIKRNFFHTEQAAPGFPGGLKLYSGISATITPTKDFGITIKVLKTHQVMYPGGQLMDFLKTNLENSNGGGRGGGRQGNCSSQNHMPKYLDQRQIRYFNGVLKGLKVETNHLGYKRKYAITGVHNESANKTIIEDLGISVTKYFQGSYKIKLQHPDLPLVKVGGKTKLPIELCTLLPNQPYFTTLDSAQQRDMIRKACQKPMEKMQDIIESSQEVSAVTSGFTGSNYGFQINPKAIELNGRVLSPPTMDKKNTVSRGAWTMSAVKEPGRIPAQVKLGFVSLLPDTRYNQALHKKFLGFIIERANALGILDLTGTNPPVRFCTVENLEQTIAGMKSAYTFVILDGLDSTYGKVKLVELVTRRTQCVKLQTVQKICGINPNPRGRDNGPGRPDFNTMDNILKKLNAKIGGVNFGINIQGLPQNIFKDQVMIVGADVTHFTRSDQKPSIAAVVATHDPQPLSTSQE